MHRVGWVMVLAGCTTELPDDTPYVDTPRILAVQVDPAEVEAGADVQLTALFADRDGQRPQAPADWSFCVRPKPLAELGPVASTCLDPASDDLDPIGSGSPVTATIPEDACSRFGPNPPPAEPDQPAGRPADPDVTGGFYQPSVGFLGRQATLVPIRVRCGIANVDQDTYVAWNQAYANNQHPVAQGFALERDGDDPIEVPLDGQGDPPAVAPGEAVTLTVSWPDCPSDGTCDGAETYVVYDAVSKELQSRREAISATWFATGGRFAEARDGRAGDDPETSVSDRWTAPGEAGEVWIAVALRDERGGVGFSSWRLDVTP